MKVALSIGVQETVRSDLGGSGVMFSIQAPRVVSTRWCSLECRTWGLGENVVQGTVDPRRSLYMVFKPLLSEPLLVPIVEKVRGEKSMKMIYATGEHPTRRRADEQGRACRPSCSATAKS